MTTEVEVTPRWSHQLPTETVEGAIDLLEDSAWMIYNGRWMKGALSEKIGQAMAGIKKRLGMAPAQPESAINQLEEAIGVYRYCAVGLLATRLDYERHNSISRFTATQGALARWALARQMIDEDLEDDWGLGIPETFRSRNYAARACETLIIRYNDGARSTQKSLRLLMERTAERLREELKATRAQ